MTRYYRQVGVGNRVVLYQISGGEVYYYHREEERWTKSSYPASHIKKYLNMMPLWIQPGDTVVVPMPLEVRGLSAGWTIMGTQPTTMEVVGISQKKDELWVEVLQGQRYAMEVLMKGHFIT